MFLGAVALSDRNKYFIVCHALTCEGNRRLCASEQSFTFCEHEFEIFIPFKSHSLELITDERRIIIRFFVSLHVACWKVWGRRKCKFVHKAVGDSIRNLMCGWTTHDWCRLKTNTFLGNDFVDLFDASRVQAINSSVMPVNVARLSYLVSSMSRATLVSLWVLQDCHI